MSTPKLALVIDKSEAFLSFQKERIFDSWGTNPTEIKKVDQFTKAGGATLFGGGTTSLLELKEADEVKQLVADLQAAEADNSVKTRIGDGLLIVATVARTSTKKLEALIAGLNGEVITTAIDKNDKMTPAQKLVSPLNLNRDARNFLLAYVGDDYEAVIPIVKALLPLSPEQQKKVSEEDIFVRLPQAPGALAPWEIEKPLMAGNISDTIEVFRRVAKHSHYLVVLKILNNKFQASYRVAALLQANPRMTDAQLAEATGVNTRTLWLHKNNSKKYGVGVLQEAAALLAKTEAQVKGGLNVDGLVVMEKVLVQLSMLFAR